MPFSSHTRNFTLNSESQLYRSGKLKFFGTFTVVAVLNIIFRLLYTLLKMPCFFNIWSLSLKSILHGLITITTPTSKVVSVHWDKWRQDVLRSLSCKMLLLKGLNMEKSNPVKFDFKDINLFCCFFFYGSSKFLKNKIKLKILLHGTNVLTSLLNTLVMCNTELN